MEAFNNFLGDLTTEINKQGGKLRNISLKNKKLAIRLQNGQEITIKNLPAIGESALFAASKVLNPKHLAKLVSRTTRELKSNDEDSDDDSDAKARATGEAAVSIFSILAIVILVIVVLAVLAFLYNRFYPGNGGGGGGGAGGGSGNGSGGSGNA